MFVGVRVFVMWDINIINGVKLAVSSLNIKNFYSLSIHQSLQTETFFMLYTKIFKQLLYLLQNLSF